MKRRTVIVLALAGLAVLWLALAWRGLPNLKAADALGTIPRFMWIAPGQVRPAPAMAPTAAGCSGRPDAEACLRRNWLTFLARFGAGELTAVENENSYRFFRLPAAGPWTVAELHVPLHGPSVLDVASLEGANASGPAPHRRVSVPAKGAVSFERRLQASNYGRMAVDTRSLRAAGSCPDGPTYLLEAHVRGFYRYVVRRACEVDAAKLQAWGDRLLALESPPA